MQAGPTPTEGILLKFNIPLFYKKKSQNQRNNNKKSKYNIKTGRDKGLFRIVNSISNAVGFFYPRCEHLFFPQKKPFLVDISESLSPLNNFSSPSISNNSNIAVERYIFATSVLLNINIFLQKKSQNEIININGIQSAVLMLLTISKS